MRFKSENIQSKISRHALGQYRKKLEESKDLDDGTFHAWVNKIQTALIFYSIYYPNKRHAWRKKNKSLSNLKQFENENRLYSGIFETAERMFI